LVESDDKEKQDRVLVVVPNLSQPGGVTNYYNALKLNGCPSIDYYFANKKSTNTYLEKVQGFVFIILGYLYKASRYDIIHINPSLNIKSFFRDLFFVLIAKLMRKKVIVFYRGWEDEFQERIHASRILSFMFRISYSRADAFIVLGELFKRKLIELGVDAEKTFYCETTVADSSNIEQLDFQGKIETYNEVVNFLFISRILETKGVYIAIDAFEICQSTLPDRKMMLYIAGDGDELKFAMGYVSKNEIANVVFTGNVSGVTKHELLSKSHVMLFPTYYDEGMPNCVLECMLYGMPIISRVNAGIPSVVKNGENGFLTESKDAETFSKYCLDVLLDKNLYKTMAEKNYLKAANLYTIEEVRSRILKIYEDVASLGVKPLS